MQMLRAPVMINAVHATLQQTEIALDGIGRDLHTIDDLRVFLVLVAHGLMAFEIFAHEVVDDRLIRVQRSTGVDMLLENRLDILDRDALLNYSARPHGPMSLHAARLLVLYQLALDHRNHWRFLTSAISQTAADAFLFWPNVHLVDFDGTGKLR